MPERAEVKAGIAAYRESLASGHSEEHAVVAAMNTALDRARDARDDNNGRCRTCGDWIGPDGCERCARSPQGEDRKAEAVAALYEFARERWGWGSEEYESVRDAVAVVLARVSPSRDGTVAVEDYVAQKEATMKLRSLGDDMARAILDLRMYEGRSAWDAAEMARDRWLAEFGSARAGGSNER